MHARQLIDHLPRLAAPSKAKLRTLFPPVEELIEKAQSCTESCVLLEQLQVSTQFFKNVAIRGVYNKRYSLEDAKRVGIIVDHIARARAKKLLSSDAAM